jgi:hypothetical protein
MRWDKEINSASYSEHTLHVTHTTQSISKNTTTWDDLDHASSHPGMLKPPVNERSFLQSHASAVIIESGHTDHIILP